MATSGHAYFALKDDASQLRCALFKTAGRLVRFKLQDGLSVIARGSLEVYHARGEYQFIVESLEAQGAGALQLAFEQLKRRLLAEGLFEKARKKPLPKLPRRIGIITSPSGAVISDILQILSRRHPGLHVRVFPASVQGEGASEQIRAGLRFFSASGWAEVVILARGGGSIEDLWTFNEEVLARAIAASRVPVISAIGHETDFTISDFVADHRAATPSAAAEIVICTRDSLIEQVNGCRSKIVQILRYRLLMAGRDLQERGTVQAARVIHRRLTTGAQRRDDADDRLRQAWMTTLRAAQKRVDELTRRLEANELRLRFARVQHRHERLAQRLAGAMQNRLWHEKRRVEHSSSHLEQLSPLRVLGRGYAIVTKPGGGVVRSQLETARGEELTVRLHSGRLDVTVSSTRRE